MSGSKRKKSKQKQRKKKSKQTSTPTWWGWYAIVIAIAVVLLGALIATQFPAIDRPAMALFTVACIGLALLIIGVCKAVGNYDFDERSRLANSLNALAHLATPNRRFRSPFRSRSTLYLVFEKILIAIILPLGFFLAIFSPRRTWPAILWVGSGILLIFGSYGVAALVAWWSY